MIDGPERGAFNAVRGTVRAIITFLLIFITAFFGYMFIKIVTQKGVKWEDVKDIMIVFTTFSNFTSIMIGSYVSKGK